jgi:hypothetical protein
VPPLVSPPLPLPQHDAPFSRLRHVDELELERGGGCSSGEYTAPRMRSYSPPMRPRDDGHLSIMRHV